MRRWIRLMKRRQRKHILPFCYLGGTNPDTTPQSLNYALGVSWYVIVFANGNSKYHNRKYSPY